MKPIKQILKKPLILRGIVLIGVLLILQETISQSINFLGLRRLVANPPNPLFESKAYAIMVLCYVFFIFIMQNKDTLLTFKEDKFSYVESTIFGLLAAITLAIHYYLRYLTNLYSIYQGPLFYCITLIQIIIQSSFLLILFLSVFNIKTTRKFYVTYKKDILKSIILCILLTIGFYWLLNQWIYLSSIVTKGVILILELFFPEVYSVYQPEGPIIGIEGFSVQVSKYCSGMEAIFLFLAFYIAIYVLDKKRIKSAVFWILLIPGLIGSIIFNMIRIFILFMVAVYISPELSVSIFHTNLGWIFFIVYFLLFYMCARKIIYKRKTVKNQGTSTM